MTTIVVTDRNERPRNDPEGTCLRAPPASETMVGALTISGETVVRYAEGEHGSGWQPTRHRRAPTMPRQRGR